jgi:hypothetical protein
MKSVADLIQPQIAELREKPGVSLDLAAEKRLPDWPESARAAPNIALRSALFSAINLRNKKTNRPYLERQAIAGQDGITIIYSGPLLDQGDFDVWETVLHLARGQAIKSEWRGPAYQFLKALNKKDTGNNRHVLDRRLSRLKATGLDVKVDGYSYEGSLIDEVYREERSREYVIRLNPKLLALFGQDRYTLIDWTIRRTLDGKPLAQWLHGYFSSHAQPYPVKVATLHRLSGSQAARMDHFRETLVEALDAVTTACAEAGQIFKYEIRVELVHVERVGSVSQVRHLLRMAARPRKNRPYPPPIASRGGR